MTQRIEGGFIVLARRLLDDDIMDKPIVWRCIWIHILLRVNWRNTKRLKRGQGFFNWKLEKDRLEGVTKDQWYKSVRWMRKTGKLATRKASHGLTITVLNYERYQDVKQYGSHTQSQTGARQRPDRSQTLIGEEGKEGKKGITTGVEFPFKSERFKQAWSDWEKCRAESGKKLTPTAIKLQLSKLAAMGEVRAIAALKHSAASNYQGIYEPEKGGGYGVERNPSRVRAEPGKYDNIGKVVGEHPPS